MCASLSVCRQKVLKERQMVKRFGIDSSRQVQVQFNQVPTCLQTTAGAVTSVTLKHLASPVSGLT